MHSLKLNLNIMRQIVETQRIFSAIYQSQVQKPPNSLLVTSSLPGEGKTLLAAALGLLASENLSQNILLIDLNWYNPALHICFNLESSYALDDLAEDKDISRLIQKTEHKNLQVLPAPIIPAAQDLSKQVISLVGKRLLHKISEEFSLVILDSAPVFPINRYMLDPVHLVTQVDATLMVVMTNYSRRQIVKRAKIELDNSQANLLGLVVNHKDNPLK